MKKAKVKYYNDYLVLCMPDGEIIPEQTDIKIENQVWDKKTATVTITLLADISEIGEPDESTNKEDKIKELEEKLCLAHKSAVFWETMCNNEKKKSWYEKLFNL